MGSSGDASDDVEEEEEKAEYGGGDSRAAGGVRGLAGEIGPEGTRRLEGFRGR